MVMAAVVVMMRRHIKRATVVEAEIEKRPTGLHAGKRRRVLNAGKGMIFNKCCFFLHTHDAV